MIGVISTIIGGLIFKVKITILSPLIYISSKIRKDLFLILFIIYCISIGYFVDIKNISSNKSLLAFFTIIMPTIFLLEDGLKSDFGMDIYKLILCSFIITGLYYNEIYIFSIFVVLIYYLLDELLIRKFLLVVLPILVLYTIIYFLCKYYIAQYIGSTPTQVTVLAAVSIFVSLILYKKLNKLDLNFKS